MTPRQQEILQRALAAGYFDVPRRISLTELAVRIGVATSTLSVTLAVIEKKIVESFPLSAIEAPEASNGPPSTRGPRRERGSSRRVGTRRSASPRDGAAVVDGAFCPDT
jgi:hypothetical protein